MSGESLGKMKWSGKNQEKNEVVGEKSRK